LTDYINHWCCDCTLPETANHFVQLQTAKADSALHFQHPTIIPAHLIDPAGNKFQHAPSHAFDYIVSAWCVSLSQTWQRGRVEVSADSSGSARCLSKRAEAETQQTDAQLRRMRRQEGESVECGRTRLVQD
jgi:hypothetical protein